MKFKIILTTTIAILFIQKGNTQQFMHAAGINFAAMTGKVFPNPEFAPLSSYKTTISQANFVYYPRFNFIEKDNSSISIGVPLNVGFGIFSTSDKSDAGTRFSYELPITLDYNLGCKSTSDNDSKWGGYLGIGYSYYGISLSGSQSSNFNGKSYGILYRAGVRFRSFAEDWFGLGLTVCFSYKKGAEQGAFTTVGMGVLADFR